MKCLFLSALLFAIATIVFAQKFEIGLNGGIGNNTVPTISDTYPFNSHKKAPPASAVGLLKLAYNYKKWKFGIEADYINLSCEFVQAQYYLINGQLVQLYSGKTVNATLGNPALPVKLFANRRIAFKHLETYYGISAGYVFLRNGFIPLATEWSPVSPSNYGHGLCAGLQIGGTYFISKHFGLNAELQGNYMSLYHDDYQLYEFLGTLGVRYRFL